MLHLVLLALAAYLSLLCLFNFLLRGKVSVGCFSWLQLHYLKFNTEKATVSVSSIAFNVHPLALFSSGSINTSFKFIELELTNVVITTLFPTTDSAHRNNSHNKSSNTDEKHIGKISYKLAGVLSKLPVGININGLQLISNKDCNNSIQFDKSSLDLRAFNEHKTELSHFNILFNIIGLKTSSGSDNLLNEFKVDLNLASPYNENSLNLKNIRLNVYCGDACVNITSLRQTIDSIIPKSNNNKQLEKRQSKEYLSSILHKFQINTVEITLGDIKLKTSDFFVNFCATQLQFKEALSFKSDSQHNLYKSTFTIDSVVVKPLKTIGTTLDIEFINHVCLIDSCEIDEIIKSLDDPGFIENNIGKENFLIRSGITIAGVSFSTSVNDIVLLSSSSKKISKNSQKVSINHGKDLVFIDRIASIMHRVRLRAHIIRMEILINLLDDKILGGPLSTQFVLEDFIVDSALNDNLNSLFDSTSEFFSMKSVIVVLRRIQISFFDGLKHYRTLLLDGFIISFSLELAQTGFENDISTHIENLNVDLNRVEVKLVDIEICKKLYKAARNYDTINKNEEREEETVKVVEKEQTKKKLLPQMIKSLKLKFNRFVFLSCFNNPVKYYNGIDQSDLNRFQRGFCFKVSDISAFIDNSPEIQSVEFNIDAIVFKLIRDYQTEKIDKSFETFLTTSNFQLKYTLLNHKLSTVLPIIDFVISPEIMWSIMFIISIITSVIPKLSRKSKNVSKTTTSESLSHNKLHLLFLMNLLMIRIKLPSDIDIVLELDSFEALFAPSVEESLSVDFKAFRTYGVNPHAPSTWSLILILSKANFKFSLDDLLDDEAEVDVNCQSFRFEVPFEYVFYQLFDNLRAFMKSFDMAKLCLQDILKIDYDNAKHFKVDVIMPSEVKKPVKLPKIQVHTKKFRFCMHDDPFEFELNHNLILGTIEQQSRLAKFSAFEEYENNIRSAFPEKYPALKFEEGSAILPKDFNLKELLKKKKISEKHEKQRAQQAQQAQNYHNSRHVSPLILSPLAHEQLSDEEEQSIRYLKDVQDLIRSPKERLLANISKSWIERVKLFNTLHGLKSSDRINVGDPSNDPLVSKQFLAKYPVTSAAGIDPLFSFDLDDLSLTLNEPSFGIENYRDFLYEVGDGMPRDMRYGILVPMNISIVCKKAKVQIKDYPLPFIMLGGDEKDSCECVKFSGDFVVIEQMYTPEEVRYNFVPFVSQYHDLFCNDSLYACHVSRTMTSVKFFTDMKVSVDSHRPSIVTWSHSLQPALGYAMNSFDVLSKPPLDISPKLGFWDKLPLTMHGKFEFLIKNGITLFIKSGLSPYDIIGTSTGFGFVWGGETNLKINSTGKSEDLLIIESKTFEIIIPTFEIRQLNKLVEGDAVETRYSVHKTVLRLHSEPVVWKLGFVFEQNINDEIDYVPGSIERMRKFKPHYDITLKNRSCFKDESEMEDYDSYKGWRCQYIHMAVSVESKSCVASNSAHLSPLTFAHFFEWWNTFKSSLGLPIKAGKMFKNKFLDYRPSAKFGTHLFSISYGLLLDSLYITHVYKHSDAAEINSKVAFTGLKCHVNSFSMDLHQAKKQSAVFDVAKQTYKKDWSLSMDKGIVDFQETDLRILTAVFNETSAVGILAREIDLDSSSSLNFERKSTSSSDFSSEVCERCWLNLDDFVELEDPISLKEEPHWKVTQLASSPRFYYVKDSHDSPLSFPFDMVERTTHSCLLDTHLDEAAPALAETRIKDLKQRIETRKFEMNSLSESSTDPATIKLKSNIKSDLKSLEQRLVILKSLKEQFKEGIFPSYEDFIEESKAPDNNDLLPSLSRLPTRTTISKSKSNILESPISESTYRNRFIVYKMVLKWSPKVRNKMLKYLDSLSDRRSIVFNLSRKAINLAEELNKSQYAARVDTKCSSEDGKQYYQFDDPSEFIDDFDGKLHDTTDLENVTTDDEYLLKFILPQVCLDNDNDRCVIAASNEIILRETSINSGYLCAGEIEELTVPVESRIGAILSDAFVYVLDRPKVLSNYYKFFHSSSSSSWPPQIPIEMYYAPGALRESVVLQDVTLGMIVKKPNKLHDLQDQACSTKNFKDSIQIFSPVIYLTANSMQYNAIYDVALSLIEFEETDSRKFKEKVKKLVKFSANEDYLQMAKEIDKTQENIRSLLSYKRFLLIPGITSSFDEEDITSISVELEKLLLRLNALVSFMQQTKARKYNDSYGLRQWSFVFDLIRLELLLDDDSKFLNIQSSKTYFTTIQNPNGASSNQVYIHDFVALDEHPEAKYKTIISRMDRPEEPMTFVDWAVYEPVGGINVVGHKNIKFAPLKLDIDYEVARKIYSFVYPDSSLTVGEKDLENDEDDLFTSKSSFSDSESLNSEFTSAVDNLSLTSASTTSDITIISDDNKTQGKISKKFKSLISKKKSGSSLKRSTSVYSSGSTSSTSSKNSAPSKPSKKKPLKKLTEEEWKNEDNVSQMEHRASLYQMFHSIKINPIQLCITFKGKGALKMVNVNNLTINVPEIEYRNAVLSNEQLFADFRVKIIKTILKHTGAFINSKIKHKSNKESKYQQPIWSPPKRRRAPNSNNNRLSMSNILSNKTPHHHHDRFLDPDLLGPGTHTSPPQTQAPLLQTPDVIHELNEETEKKFFNSVDESSL